MVLVGFVRDNRRLLGSYQIHNGVVLVGVWLRRMEVVEDCLDMVLAKA
jgi:hypothetical protein